MKRYTGSLKHLTNMVQWFLCALNYVFYKAVELGRLGNTDANILICSLSVLLVYCVSAVLEC